jgi:predicted HTH domain antitoxin
MPLPLLMDKQPVRSILTTRLYSSPTTDASNMNMNMNIMNMRVKEIKDELEELNVDCTDCFDKESLVSRLVDARNGKVETKTNTKAKDETLKEETATNDDKDKDKDKEVAATTTTTTTIATPSFGEFDKEAVLEELRGMRVRELSEELGRRQIRRAGLFEKEDLVQALVKAREQASNFSPTGLILPGQVADLTEDQLEEEMKHPTPLLLDVYATPMMAPQLQQAAAESFGDKIRVAKMDSDKNPQLAGRLRVGGLPTLVLFNNGQEVDRIEGALMKDQLVEWVNSKL